MDVEPRRILLSIPGLYALDINLNLPESTLGRVDAGALDDSPKDNVDLETVKVKGFNARQALLLKKEREFDVDRADAEWVVTDKKLIITV